MSGTAERPMVVEYYGHELHLTRDEYWALKTAALDDPVSAQEMADRFAAREP